jgi:hypothetical protein
LFKDSGAAVATFEATEWLKLLKHNLADIQQTLELMLPERVFVLKSDFSIRKLELPRP